jgi:CPA1 family monovalent cation:H+ antiporter
VTIAGGGPFSDRSLLIFLTFSVILVTLVGGGLTLPIAVARLGVKDDNVSADEEQTARAAMASAALARIDESERAGRLDAHTTEILRRRYRRQLATASRGQLDAEPEHHNHIAQQLAEAEQEILIAQRSTLIDLRRRGEIDNVVLRRLQLMLDMEQVQLDGRSRRGVS